MESGFWILGWILSILTITGSGFIVLLVSCQRQLRTKTNALIVSLSVADFCFGAFDSLFLHCSFVGCNWLRPYAFLMDFIRWLFAYASIMNLCSLALDRYMAVVKPLKYVAIMTARCVNLHQFLRLSLFVL